MTALICMMTCGALFSADVQAAQKTVRVKEKTEISYLVDEDGSKEIQDTVRTEYIYGETGNLQEELVYKTYYEGEYLWRKRTYYANGVLKSSSGMTSPINLQSYESHYDQYGHLMEPSSSMVDYYNYEEFGVVYPLYEYDEEYDEVGSEYPDFLVDEFIPWFIQKYDLKIDPNPDMHMVAGSSSGGISAWNIAWFSDPVMLGVYPQDGLKGYEQYLPRGWEKDLES